MFFMRHGQSVFNAQFHATGKDPGVRDAPLTKRGVEQAVHSALTLKDKNIQRLVTSPYSRALQTAHEVAKILNLNMVANPLVGERRLYSCDIGTPTSLLKQDWPQVDFAALEKEEWWPHLNESDDDIQRRVAAFQSQMAGDPLAANTLVVSHWYFIFTLSAHDCDNAQIIKF